MKSLGFEVKNMDGRRKEDANSSLHVIGVFLPFKFSI